MNPLSVCTRSLLTELWPLLIRFGFIFAIWCWINQNRNMCTRQMIMWPFTHAAFAYICIKHIYTYTHGYNWLYHLGPCVVTDAQIVELMCGTHFVAVSSDYIHWQPPALHKLVILNLSAAAWTMIQASSQRSEQQCSSSKKTTAINLVQLLLSSFTFYYSLLHHLENGSCVSLARLLQLHLNLCSTSISDNWHQDPSSS